MRSVYFGWEIREQNHLTLWIVNGECRILKKSRNDNIRLVIDTEVKFSKRIILKKKLKVYASSEELLLFLAILWNYSIP